MPIIRASLAACVFALAACSPAGEQASPTSENKSAASSPAASAPEAKTAEAGPPKQYWNQDDPCNASNYPDLVGLTEAEVRERNLPQGARVYREGEPVTMDFSAERLNVVIGGDGAVKELKCG